MSIEIKDITDGEIKAAGITCSNCHASCCHYEVMIISDTGVPERHITENEWGVEVMLRLEDGWCSAMDRNTHMCTIYEKRPYAASLKWPQRIVKQHAVPICELINILFTIKSPAY